MPGTELRVVDHESGADLGPGEPGELWVRGPQTMAGYLHRPDATAAMIDADGWLHTGDLVVIDEEGQVFIVDRLKELIKVNAFQVAPAELEAVLAMHPAVADAAVIGRPDARHRRGAGGVGRRPRARSTPEELMAWVAARVAPYKRLRAVRFVDAIPRTPAGKILRRVPASRTSARRCELLAFATDGAVAVGEAAPDHHALVIEVRGGAARGAREARVHAARGRELRADGEHVRRGRRCRRPPCPDALRSSGRGSRRRA